MYTLPSSLRAEHEEKCVCPGRELSGHPGGGARRAPGPTASYLQRESWLLLFCLGPKRHWPLSPSELGCPSGMPTHPHGGMGGIRMWEEGGRIPLRNQEGLGWVEGPCFGSKVPGFQC